jgi:hypothetical protein
MLWKFFHLFFTFVRDIVKSPPQSNVALIARTAAFVNFFLRRIHLCFTLL